MGKPVRVYVGGELFSAKHLLGNAVLAEEIHRLSQGAYLPVLPQNIELRNQTPRSIRDHDIRALIECEAALFNYDGPELDSGTVVEFMIAKFADIPSVLLRTDFRLAGDQGAAGEPWNLMSSFYPRTRTVLVPAMSAYKEGPALHGGGAQPEIERAIARGRSSERAKAVITRTAASVIEALDSVIVAPPVLPADLEPHVRRWIELMPGSALP